MYIHEVTYSTNNNIYVTASYAIIIIVEGRHLNSKPSLLFVLGTLHTDSHTPAELPDSHPRPYKWL